MTSTDRSVGRPRVRSMMWREQMASERSNVNAAPKFAGMCTEQLEQRVEVGRIVLQREEPTRSPALQRAQSELQRAARLAVLGASGQQHQLSRRERVQQLPCPGGWALEASRLQVE